MAVSKGRKKKKKPSKKKHNKKTIFNDGALEFIQKGRNIFIKNVMSPEQHKEYLEQLRANYPKAYEEIRLLIKRAVELINSYDKVLIIGGIAAYGMELMRKRDSDDSIPETSIEYCQSIATATENINKGKVPTGEILKEIYDLLSKIRKYFSAYYSFEKVTEKYNELESEVRLNMILENLFVRGEGYSTHITELFNEMFSLHDELLIKTYGYSSSDLVETFKKLEECFACRLMLPNGRPHPFQRVKLSKWLKENKVSMESVMNGSYLPAFAKDNPEIVYEKNMVVLYPLNGIETYRNLFRIRHFNNIQKKVVESISLKFGDNKTFSEPEKIGYQILNKTLINLKPVIEEDGTYYLFGFNLGVRNLFSITQALIKAADIDYYNKSFLGNRILKSKDQFIERKVQQLFKEMLPNVEFHPNVKYKFSSNTLELKCARKDDSVYELDLLGISEKAIYLIEVKAGLITDEAKRGAIESIKKNLSDIIGDAACQSYRASIYVNEDANPEFILQNNEPLILEKGERTVFRCSISFSYAGTIITGLSKLQEIGIIDEKADFGWTVNIYDLMAFSELIESEEQFIDYLSKRLPFYRDKRLVDVDELDMLGLYFEEDFRIHKSQKEADNLRFHGFHSKIDAYFESEGEKPVKKKRKK